LLGIVASFTMTRTNIVARWSLPDASNKLPEALT